MTRVFGLLIGIVLLAVATLPLLAQDATPEAGIVPLAPNPEMIAVQDQAEVELLNALTPYWLSVAGLLAIIIGGVVFVTREALVTAVHGLKDSIPADFKFLRDGIDTTLTSAADTVLRVDPLPNVTWDNAALERVAETLRLMASDVRSNRNPQRDLEVLKLQIEDEIQQFGKRDLS
jgi:hypothetical protein